MSSSRCGFGKKYWAWAAAVIESSAAAAAITLAFIISASLGSGHHQARLQRRDGERGLITLVWLGGLVVSCQTSVRGSQMGMMGAAQKNRRCETPARGLAQESAPTFDRERLAAATRAVISASDRFIMPPGSMGGSRGAFVLGLRNRGGRGDQVLDLAAVHKTGVFAHVRPKESRCCRSGCGGKLSLRIFRRSVANGVAGNLLNQDILDEIRRFET